MRRLKFDNDTRTKVVRLVKWHGLKYDASEVSVRRALNRVGQDIFEDFIKVQHADIEARIRQLFRANWLYWQRRRKHITK